MTKDIHHSIEHNLRYKVLLSENDNHKMNLFDRMKFYNVKGVSIVVIKDAKIEWCNTYGVQDNNSQSVLDKNILFQAGSISKSLTTLGILLLVSQSKISLDENVNHYLKSWKLQDNEFSLNEKVTLRRILSHSAGLSVSGFPGYTRNAILPTIVQVLDGVPPANTKSVSIIETPGKQFRYSGGGTTISQLIIEDITKEPFADWMRENILIPLNMTNSTFQQPPELNFTCASGHNHHGEVIPGMYHLYPEMAAAGLWSTSTDLAQFVTFILRNFQKPEDSFIDSGLIKEMLTPQIKIAEKYFSGLGLFLEETNNHEVIFEHGGQDEGFIALYCGLIKQQCGFVIMMNTEDNGWYLMEEIKNGIADVYSWDRFEPIIKTSHHDNDKTLYQQFIGTYSNEKEGEINITLRNNHLFLKETPEMVDIKLHAENNYQFFTQEGNHKIQFLLDENAITFTNSRGQVNKFLKSV